MKVAIVCLLALLAGAVRTDPRAPVPAETARFTRSLALPSDKGLAVEATVGDVTIAGWNRPDVSIEIVRHAPSAQDLASWPVTVDEAATPVRIAVVQPNEGTDAALRSSTTISAPVSTVFEAVRVVEGKITLANLRRAVSADIRRGSIEAKALSGAVRLEALVGNVTLQNAELSDDGVIRLRAFNGDVRLHLTREPPNARILALTFNGTIRSSIPLDTKTAFGPQFGDARRGRGEPVISIDVVTGNIEITTGR